MKKINSFKQYAAGLSHSIDQTELEEVDGDWEIEQIIDVSTEPPIDESLILNPHLTGDNVKRGDFIYITAIINKPGGRITSNSVGVIKARVVNIYNSILPLNKIDR